MFSTSETAYAVNRNGRIMAWNRAAEQSFGFTESEALNQMCWKLLSGRDIFGNHFCCEGCPISVSAFNGEPINRFQIVLKTSRQEYKRCTVTTLMLFNNPSEELLLHLCNPKPEAFKHAVKEHPSAQSVFRYKYKTLTPREIEVLTFFNDGMTVTEIASALDICIATVRNHTQHILFKLGVHSQLEAIAIGRKLNFI